MTYLTFLVDTIGILVLLSFLFNQLVNRNDKNNNFANIAAYSLLSALSLVMDMLVQIKELYINDTQREIFAFVEYFLVFMIVAVLNFFIFSFVKLKPKTNKFFSTINLLLLIISICMLVGNLFEPFLYYVVDETITCLDYLWLAFSVGSISCLLGLIAIIQTGKASVYLSCYGIFGLYAVLKLLYPQLPIINIAVVLASVIMVVVSLQDEAKKQVERELELANNDAQLMLSQIQPHFLYNTLSAISSICEKDAKLASKTIDDFAFYLRGNLDSMRNDKSTFDLELKHTQYYTQLEKLRFGDYLNVEYDIQVTNFSFPTLALQPIVENAIRHGVSKKEEGGHVYVSSREDENQFIVKIEDDGVGFDPNEKLSGSHVGIENVKRRIELIVKGKMNIYSRKNEGTIVTITIPKK